MRRKAVRTSRIFLYWIQSGFAHDYITMAPTDDNMELGSGNMGLKEEEFAFF